MCINDNDNEYLDVCLYQSPGGSGGQLLPVLVWVHGGAFICGSGNYSSAGFDFFLAEGMVVVTINYRLGLFGMYPETRSSINLMTFTFQELV